ncbi:hypothetical protein QCN27_15330 [Cereibacter sp. SYSU M97828]|nr:hypothetical protein [Cereibacter flavus]
MTDTNVEFPIIAPLPRPAAAPQVETPMDRLRRLEASLTDDSQGWLERQDAQGEVDLRNLTRAGLVLAVLSTALMVWLLV